jgi:hypothetical protein
VTRPPHTPAAAPPGPHPTGASVAQALDGLREWLADAVGADAVVEIAAPDPDRGLRLCVWPLGLLADQGTRGGYAQRTIRLRARHAVVADGPVDAALALLDKVLSALAGEDRYQLVLEPVPAGVWGTGVPRPAVLVDVPVQIAIAPPAAPRVTAGLRLDGGPMRVVTGRVVGPGDVALPGMTVSSPTTGTSVVTDSRGGFTLAGQPAGRAVALQLAGRGLHLQVEVGPAMTDPVVVHCPIELGTAEAVPGSTEEV